MPFEYITESATAETISEFYATEISSIIASCQLNAEVETRLQQLLDVAHLLTTITD